MMTALLLLAAVLPGLILLNVFLFLVLNLTVFRRPTPDGGGPRTADGEALPTLSVLVPARNEERSIHACLASLKAQLRPGIEIILLDDGSTDGTASIARDLGFGDRAPLRLLAGQPLPDGWTGKAWACHQLARAAAGEWMLFTDADTVHEPGGLDAALGFAARRGAALCSAWPRQITGSFAELLVIPLVYLLVLGFLPQAILTWLQRKPGIAARLPRPWLRSLGAANGQFMLFHRAAYDAVGGHESVRNHLVEDVALGRAVASRTADGLRLINCDGGALVRCRMYRSAAEVWDGFTKNLRQAFEGSPGAFVFSLGVQAVGFFLPFLLVWFGGAWSLVAAAQIGMVYLIRGILAVRFRGSPLSVLLHPVGHAFALAIALNSWRQWASGSVRWKDRDYSKQSLG